MQRTFSVSLLNLRKFLYELEFVYLNIIQLFIIHNLPLIRLTFSSHYCSPHRA